MNPTIFREIWIESTEDEYFDNLCALPPSYHLGDGERMSAFLLGEPSDHFEGFPVGHLTYRAFLYFQEGYYRSRRPMTVLKFQFEMEELKR